MSDEIFTRVLDQIKNLMPEYVNLSGWGEPVMDKKLFSRINQISELGIRTGLTSNFTLINNDAKIKELMSSGINDIGISFDGGTREIYESIRTNANFEDTFNNILALSRSNDASDRKIDISITYVVMKENIEDMQVLLDKLSRNSVKLRGFIIKPLDVVSDKSNFKSIVSRYDIKRALKAIKTDYNVITWNVFKEDKAKSDCLASVRSSTFINYQGMVSPCCNLGHPVPRLKSRFFLKIPMSSHFVGDLTKESLLEIWNKDEYITFREKIRHMRVPSQCKYCNLI